MKRYAPAAFIALLLGGVSTTLLANTEHNTSADDQPTGHPEHPSMMPMHDDGQGMMGMQGMMQMMEHCQRMMSSGPANEAGE